MSWSTMACWLSETVYQMTVNSLQRWAWMDQVLLLTFHFSPLLRHFPRSLIVPSSFHPYHLSLSPSLPLPLHFSHCSQNVSIGVVGDKQKLEILDDDKVQPHVSWNILFHFCFVPSPHPAFHSLCSTGSISPMFKTLTGCSIAGRSGLNKGRQGTTNGWGRGGGGGWGCQMRQVWFISSLIDQSDCSILSNHTVSHFHLWCLVYSQFVFVLQVDSTMEQDKVSCWVLIGLHYGGMW